MALASVDNLIADIRGGKMVILMDDEDRENEGDLVLAGAHCTSEHVNFMARHARGLICLTLTEARCKQLGLPPMVVENTERHKTAFTVSIEAAEGVTTGISASDRARTVQAAVAPNAKPTDLVQPGHIFPVQARAGGVLMRAGHTEAGCDLARLAGLEPAAVICEIMNDDGSMARRPELEAFAERHDILIGTIADLIQYRVTTETTIEMVREESIETEFGPLRLQLFQDQILGGTHVCLIKGDPSPEHPCLVRVHVPDTLRDLVQVSWQGRGSWPLPQALKMIADAGEGVVVILENRGDEPIEERLAQYAGDTLPNPGTRLVPYLTVGTGSQILKHANVGKMRLLSTPMKFSAISGFDLEVVEYLEYKG
ncbi:MAG: 3,4-dihydroxy-2-butanone-4-phosphate synthase [Litorivicinaceae bacterium]|nr:3,4-dihydroxy-2-butanone-4-phosphate synthase [Gammaproteobacteria bacterium]RPG20225.1 MAG: 3,4-dihydroxy-2-butanone-4-phosphate synthase [Oceanospirillales bacterium TMED33]RZO74847.1 MAG: 3,4-dihydroxy-2-butanone-4-phosphate synthase [Litorivicinaceae bacterium]